MIHHHYLSRSSVIDLAKAVAAEKNELGRLALPPTEKALIPWLCSHIPGEGSPSRLCGFTTVNDRICSFHCFLGLNEEDSPGRKWREYGATAFFECFAIFRFFQCKGRSLKVFKMAIKCCEMHFGEGPLVTRVHASNIPMQRIVSAAGFARLNEHHDVNWERRDGRKEILWDYILNPS